ncbi:hypothetical protein ZTR_10905, partial [Talaromyces verruculosus]
MKRSKAKLPVASPPPPCGWESAQAQMPPRLKCQNIKNLNPSFINVKNTANMTSNAYKEEEALIAKIFSAYDKKNKPNFSKLERDYGISRRKLSRAWNRKPSRTTRPPTNRKLSLDQEKALFLWLEYLDNIGAPPTNLQIEESANYLLAKDSTTPGEPPRVGK